MRAEDFHGPSNAAHATLDRSSQQDGLCNHQTAPFYPTTQRLTIDGDCQKGKEQWASRSSASAVNTDNRERARRRNFSTKSSFCSDFTEAGGNERRDSRSLSGWLQTSASCASSAVDGRASNISTALEVPDVVTLHPSPRTSDASFPDLPQSVVTKDWVADLKQAEKCDVCVDTSVSLAFS